MGGMPPEGPRQGHTGTASNRGTRSVASGAPSEAGWLSGSPAGHLPRTANGDPGHVREAPIKVIAGALRDTRKRTLVQAVTNVCNGSRKRTLALVSRMVARRGFRPRPLLNRPNLGPGGHVAKCIGNSTWDSQATARDRSRANRCIVRRCALVRETCRFRPFCRGSGG
jgi:hypothetical protein